MRENRTHGSEGGDGESRFRPLSDFRGLEISVTAVSLPRGDSFFLDSGSRVQMPARPE